ncbi:MAG: hypothetical protein ACI31C_00135 [Muribaculaceae bacterium]
MKKIFLLAAAALMLTFSAQARKLTFYIGDTPITSGETVPYEDIVVYDYGDYKEVNMKPDLYITTDIYTSKATIIARCTSGEAIQMCAGGACAKGETVTKNNITLNPGNKLALMFDYIVELDADEEIPTVVTEFEAQDGDYTETYITYTLIMGKDAGVTLIENNTSLRGIRGGVAYDVESDTALQLFTLEGVRVLDATVNGTGSLNLGLASGIYVYTLGAQSGKLYIK